MSGGTLGVSESIIINTSPLLALVACNQLESLRHWCGNERCDGVGNS